MRLYKGQIDDVSQDLLDALLEEEQIEVEPAEEEEVRQDIISVLNEYLRLDRELYEQAKDMAAERGGSVGKFKHKLEEEKGVKLSEDPVGYIMDQIIETFFHSNFVKEIFAPDNALRVTMKPVLVDYMSVEEELDEEVRDKIKNLEEGSEEWEVEYNKVKSRLKKTKDLE